MKQCRNCRYWGPSILHLAPIREVHAECRLSENYMGQTELCEYWEEREGEPLGCGLSKLWWHPTLFERASIIHDLRYDALSPGESTYSIDREWYRNAWAASSTPAERQLARLGYLIIRAYGIGRAAVTLPRRWLIFRLR